MTPLVLVVARDGDGVPRDALDWLRERISGWAAELGEVRQVAGPIGEAVAAAFAEDAARPVVAVAADVPRLGPEHVRAALADLAAGAGVAVGPGLGGGWYLVALAGPAPELFATGDFEAHRAMERTLAAAGQAGLEVGMIRPERVLKAAADVRAARVDPLTPPELLARLRG